MFKNVTFAFLAFSLCAHVDASAQTSLSAAEMQEVQDGSKRLLCPMPQCSPVPYLQALKAQSLPLPPAVEDAFEKGYFSIENSSKTTGGPEEKSFCGSFFVDKEERLLITAYHCLPPYASQLNNALHANGIAVEYVDGIPSADLALLRIAEVPAGKEVLAFREAVINDAVFGRSLQTTQFAADPTGSSKTLVLPLFFQGPVSYNATVTSKGEAVLGVFSSEAKGKNISTTMEPTGYQMLRLEGQASAEPGFSGSPVYDQWGSVVGIMSASGSGVTIVSSAKNFSVLLEKHRKSAE